MAENFSTDEENKKFSALRDLEESGKLDEIGLASTQEQFTSGKTPVNNLIHKYGALTFDLVAEALFEPTRLLENLGKESEGDAKADAKTVVDMLLKEPAIAYNIVAQAIGMDEADVIKYMAAQRMRDSHDNEPDFNKKIKEVASTRSTPDETRGLAGAEEPELDPLFFENADKFNRRVDDHYAQIRAIELVNEYRAKREEGKTAETVKETRSMPVMSRKNLHDGR